MSSRSLSLLKLCPVILYLSFVKSFGGPPENVSEDMIVSVLHRGDAYIAATTKSGIYQASESEKVWRKMPTPASMPAGGILAQESPASSRLLYFTGHDSEWRLNDAKGSLFVSDDGGKGWAASSLNPTQNVIDAFAHPNGSIFAVTDTQSTTPLPGQNESEWAYTTGVPGVKHYEAQNLLVSRDKGQTWRDITPPLHLHFGIHGIFQDPDHPDLVCVQSTEINHTSLPFCYQAADETYHWEEIPREKWPAKNSDDDFFLSGNSMMPAYLENFFKYPYHRSGNHPALPTSYLTVEKPAYSFHLHQPMLVNVSTFFMEPGSPVNIIDNTNAKVFWGLRIRPKGENIVSIMPQIVELNWEIPGKHEKLAAFWSDPHLFKAEADQAHPYQRVIDLRQLYDFSKPGEYRLAIFTDSTCLDQKYGSRFDSLGFDVSILP